MWEKSHNVCRLQAQAGRPLPLPSPGEESGVASVAHRGLIFTLLLGSVWKGSAHVFSRKPAEFYLRDVLVSLELWNTVSKSPSLGTMSPTPAHFCTVIKSLLWATCNLEGSVHCVESVKDTIVFYQCEKVNRFHENPQISVLQRVQDDGKE